MGYGRRWKPSKSSVAQFKKKMDEISDFCNEKGIIQSRGGDSYHFTINNQKYRVSNHTVEASNAAAYRDGIQIRDVYHEGGKQEDIMYIFAGKTRIIEIYNDLEAGYELDHRGNRKDNPPQISKKTTGDIKGISKGTVSESDKRHPKKSHRQRDYRER